MENLSITCPVCHTEFTADKAADRTRERRLSNSEKYLADLERRHIDTSDFFALKNEVVGIDCIVRRNTDGSVRQVSIEELDDFVQESLRKNGYIHNATLWRRWIMAQVFRMMAHKGGFLAALRALGYDYSLRVVVNELKFLTTTRLNDRECFLERMPFFTKEVIVDVVQNDLDQLTAHIKAAKVRRNNGRPYKKVCGKSIFVDALDSTIIAPLKEAVKGVRRSTSKTILARYEEYLKLRPHLRHAEMSKLFVSAYQASGAYFTLKNMLMFHGCKLRDTDDNVIDSLDAALAYIKARAIECCQKGEGYKLFGLLKQFISYNNFDFRARMAEIAARTEESSPAEQ